MTVLRSEPVGEGGRLLLPLSDGLAIYAEGVAPGVVARNGRLVPTPAEADVALVRLAAWFDPRSDLILEEWFHQGSLDFPPGRVVRLRASRRIDRAA